MPPRRERAATSARGRQTAVPAAAGRLVANESDSENGAHAVSGDSRRRHDGGDRNLPVAIASGLGLAALMLVCFVTTPVAGAIFAAAVVMVASGEAFAAFRRGGRSPATLLGLVGSGSVVIAAYAKGVSALPLVTTLLLAASFLWYLVGVQRRNILSGISSTLLGYAWVGLTGSFAGLLLAPSLFPHRHGTAFILGAIFATAAHDIGSLAIGGWLGKSKRHLIAPAVSPGKTVEGLVGGTVFALLMAALVVSRIHPWTIDKALLLGLVVSIVAPFGDLFESIVKRDLGIKDMGSLLPGHGGLLDRIDALLFVLPATYYLVRALHLG